MPEETTIEGAQDAPQNDKPAQDAAAQTGASTDEKMFPQSYVSELRDENAKTRIKLREVQEQLDKLTKAQQSAEDDKLKEQQKWQELAEKRQQELAAMQNELKAKDLQIERVRIAAEFNLNVLLDPDDDSGDTLADRLRGETPDELREDAKRLARLLNKAAAAQASPAEAAQQKPEEQLGEKAPEKTARRPATTTAVPGGPADANPEAAMREAFFGGVANSPMFNDGEFIYHGGDALPEDI